ncbi:MAG: hypothetical protein ABSB73_04550 [Solirubrobacteraceae bacterium]|jgi:hypothetical protein
MLIALGVCAVVAVVLAWEVLAASLKPALAHWRARMASGWGEDVAAYDPGRERRAEHRARELLRSCVDEEDWEMYRDLGFLRVWGSDGSGTGAGHGVAPYAYLIYPHKPIVAYVPRSSRLLSEYCVDFPDTDRPFGSVRLPPSDDVLAKWMALTADERRLIENANLHLAGRQLDPDAVRSDIAALSRWEHERRRRRDAGSLRAT